MVRTTFLFMCMLAGMTGCDSPSQSPEDVRRAEMPKVRNIRPKNVPNDKATLQVQAETIFLRLDADTSELWPFVSTEGLDSERVKLWEQNGLRVGTVDSVSMTQFLTKLPRTGGSKKINIGAGREPVVLETTPVLERSVAVRTILGLDRDETTKLPAGRMQLLMDVVMNKDAITATLTPHHHWVTPTIHPRAPAEKALDGRVFKELALDADLSDDRLIVVAWSAPKAPDVKPAAPVAPAPVPTELDPTPTTNDDAAPVRADPAPSEPPARRDDSPTATPPKLGDLLLTGTRAGKPLQLICVIRVPRSTAALPDTPVRPD